MNGSIMISIDDLSNEQPAYDSTIKQQTSEKVELFVQVPEIPLKETFDTYPNVENE